MDTTGVLTTSSHVLDTELAIDTDGSDIDSEDGHEAVTPSDMVFSSFGSDEKGILNSISNSRPDLSALLLALRLDLL
jgi:hypothetical protein